MTQRTILFLPPVGLARDILSERARATLTSLGQVTWNTMERDYTAEELGAMLPEADAVITSWGSPTLTEELLSRAPRLRLVGHAAGSVKHLMPKEGYDRGVVVLSASAVIADSVAEYTLWAMLSMQRDLYRHDHTMKVEHAWKHGPAFGHELYGKKVGLVSASMIGRRVIVLLRPFHCEITVYDPYLSAVQAMDLGARRVSLEELFAENDIVSVHAPITPETRAMIGAPHFRAMQDGALFINTARAWVLDESALVAELATGRIRAVLDVYNQEPLPADHPLRGMDNVFLTPHVAGFTFESRMRLVEAIADDMARFYGGEMPRLAVSWERLQTMA